MEAAPPPHERAMEPENILRQLSKRKTVGSGGGGGGVWTVESTYYM